ncbi:MAG: hypothetical protein N3D20_00580 [Candidatus Pacearchaeota archaeon]|nr:hypothetical protein [Candidatus Pacearchaeota archaeon]
MSRKKPSRLEMECIDEHKENIPFNETNYIKLENKEFTDILLERLKTKNPLYYKVIEKSYIEGKTLNLIGKELGYSREYIRLIKIEALRLLYIFAIDEIYKPLFKIKNK